MCAISIQLSDGSSLLVVNVYFLTTSKDALIIVLGELEALIGTQQCDHLLVAGDFNIDFSCNSVCCRTLLNFFNQHALTPIHLHLGDNVGWTFEAHSGESCSWIDHTVVSNSLVNKIGVKLTGF